MTKLKSKKMTKSTLAIIIMAIAIVAMLAFGGTYAFFQAEATTKSGSVTMGTIDLSVGDFNLATGTKVSGDVLFSGTVTYTSNADVKSIVVVEYEGDADVFNFTVDNDFALITGLNGTKKYYYAILTGDGTVQTKNFIEASEIKVNVNDNLTQERKEAGATVATKLKTELLGSTPRTIEELIADDTTFSSAWTKLSANAKAAYTAAYNAETDASAKIDAVVPSDNAHMGKSYEISIAAKAIQYRGLPIEIDSSTKTVDSPEPAYTAGQQLTIAQSAAHELFGATLAPVEP